MKPSSYKLLIIMISFCYTYTTLIEQQEIYTSIQNNNFISNDRQLQLYTCNDTNQLAISPLNPLLIQNPQEIYQVNYII